MLTNKFDPVAFSIFSLDIRWYSLAYIFGILLGWIYCKKILIKDKNLLNLFDEYISYLIIGIILGGRLGYIIFYNPFYYLNNLLEIFMIWNGGMSFHGGLSGMVISIYLFSKITRISFFYLSDLVSLVAPIGLFLGRIANFINTELYGRVTDFPFAIIFPIIDNKPRHPSQIYEALFEGIILFLILFLYFKKNHKKYKAGNVGALFLIFYSIFRFTIEFLREPDPQLGLFINYFSMGQILCIPLFIVGIIIFYRK